jgi:deoxyribodipyrimidine photo-lyase
VELARLTSDARVTVRRKGPPDPDGTCVVYWMQRAQRAVDNPALDIAVDVANALGKPCVTFFAPVPFYPHANLRHYTFLAEAIADIGDECLRRNIGFVLRRWPEHSLIRFCEEVRPAIVIADENPLREPNAWRDTASRKLRVPLWTVDADVVVPANLFPRAQYAARVIRPKLMRWVRDFLVAPSHARAAHSWVPPRGLASLDPKIGTAILDGWPLDRSVSPVSNFRGGSKQGMRLLRNFVRNKLRGYERDRSRPELDGTSQLSPYLHFGHISVQRVAWEVEKSDLPPSAKDAFLDQLITWRELAVNFVRTCPDYDTFACAEPWAKRTLAEHQRDERPVVYSLDQLERCETADDLWNAAQRQMLSAGWMHNVMRMYWAKKILEWTKSPAEAFERTRYLNDKYFLDGRDPNGYAGIAWSIAGKFDRPWFERPIFGTIRYMSRASTGRKFNSKQYISRWLSGGQPKLNFCA